MRRHQVLLVVAVLTVAGVACSSDSSEPTTGTDTTTSEPADTPVADAGTLRIVDFAFEPSDVRAGEGGSLAITNEGSTTHTFTMDDGSIDEEIEPGASVDVVIGEAGGFHCEIHPSMTGTVETE